MAEGNYARLGVGGAQFSILVPPVRRRGRPKGSTGTKGWTWEPRYDGQCKECGESFKAKSAAAKFCSRKCQTKHQNRVLQQRRRNNDPRPCQWCGVSFVPEYGSFRIAYCTLECKATAKRKVRSGSSHKRRASKFGGCYEVVNKRKVFERDGWSCYLCGCDTPKELSGTKEPNAPELEHVIPLAQGGDHTYANVRCACRECNRRKGAALIHAAVHQGAARSLGPA